MCSKLFQPSRYRISCPRANERTSEKEKKREISALRLHFVHLDDFIMRTNSLKSSANDFNIITECFVIRNFDGNGFFFNNIISEKSTIKLLQVILQCFRIDYVNTVKLYMRTCNVVAGVCRTEKQYNNTQIECNEQTNGRMRGIYLTFHLNNLGNGIRIYVSAIIILLSAPNNEENLCSTGHE